MRKLTKIQCVRTSNGRGSEVQAISTRNDTWVLAKAPIDKKIIGLKWIYKTRYNASGDVQKYKERLVVVQYTQERGIDYEDVFSQVARLETTPKAWYNKIDSYFHQ